MIGLDYTGGSGAKEAVEQDGKNDAADDDVDLVFLSRKTIDAVSDAHDRGRDQKQNAQADDAATVEVTNAVEDRREPVGGTGNSVKMAIVRLSLHAPATDTESNQPGPRRQPG